jgi:teichuronic acid biosynthesis glycosyltransferase TuaC
LKSLHQKPDLIYGHFLYNAGRAAVAAGERLSVPSIVAVGEGTFWTVDPFGFDRAKIDFEGAAGFIAVASHIRDGLVEQIAIPPGKITVEPNGVDRSRFRPIGRQRARGRLGLDASTFLVAFVGAFDDLKGGSELVRATKGIDGAGLLLLGKGDADLSSDRIVFKGSVSHDQVHVWLNAADVFVLPTTEEGSCNAVIEAMACGLPIVTSNGRYMDDLVDDEVAIRVNPKDVSEIRDAILALKNDPDRRTRMSVACLEKVKLFDIDERACRVTGWMEELVSEVLEEDK